MDIQEFNSNTKPFPYRKLNMGVIEELSLLEQAAFITPDEALKGLALMLPVCADAQLVDLINARTMPLLANGNVLARPAVLYFKIAETSLSLFTIVGSARVRLPGFGGFAIGAIQEEPEELLPRIAGFHATTLDMQALNEMPPSQKVLPNEIGLYASPFDASDIEAYVTRGGFALQGGLEIVR